VAEQIFDGRGNAYALAVNSDGSINTVISGNIVIGSVSANVDSIYVQSGTMFIVSGNAWSGIGSVYSTNSVLGSNYTLYPTPTLVSQNPAKQLLYLPYSGTSVGIGSVLGSIIQFIGTGSFVKILGYDAGYSLINVGSWV